MRKDDSGSFRGSVFVTFADPACARSAVANPPTQLGSSSSERLTVMMRQDYDSKAAHGGGAAGGGRGSSSKKDRHGRKRSKGEDHPSPLPMKPSQAGAASPSGQGEHWRGVAEERERRIRELEETLRSERELREREASRTNQVGVVAGWPWWLTHVPSTVSLRLACMRL